MHQRRKIRFRFPTVAWPIGLLLCAAAPASEERGPKLPTSIPFELFSKQILLKVTVNASEPFWFVLDSGASACVVDLALAQKLGIKAEGETEGTGAGAGKVKFGLAHNVAYGLPGLSLPVRESYLIDLSGQPSLLGRYIGGILGYDFFAPYVVDLDYDARILTFIPQRTSRRATRPPLTCSSACRTFAYDLQSAAALRLKRKY